MQAAAASAAAVAAAESRQSCPTLCYPIDSSPPGSPVPGILQARTLEWVAISFSNAWKWKVKLNSARGFPFLHTFSSIVYRFCDVGHSGWYEVISHCCFDLHFLIISDVEHLFVCLLGFLTLSHQDWYQRNGNGTKGWSVAQQDVTRLKVSKDNSSTVAVAEH